MHGSQIFRCVHRIGGSPFNKTLRTPSVADSPILVLWRGPPIRKDRGSELLKSPRQIWRQSQTCSGRQDQDKEWLHSLYLFTSLSRL